MMSLLKSIKTELQHMIEAMYAVTGIDITIVDENMERVVGTSHLREIIGKKAPLNSVFHKCLISGEQYFLENPTTDPVCNECSNIGDCKELVELCLPIRFKGKIIGVLGMCAYDEKAKLNLILNQDSYIKYENQLSSIVSTVLSEKNFGEMLEYRSTELLTLINSLNEGIIILNNDKTIVTTNKYICERIGLDRDRLPQIWELIPSKIYEKLIEKNFNGEVGPIKINEFEVIINASPIFIKNRQEGIILVFSDFDKMRESVAKSNRKKDLITFEDIVGESEAIQYARRQAIQVAERDASVLIMGETGTGKEVFARAIHSASPRKRDVFMAINCGAIPENLIESELFGYEKGSFTGASSAGKLGKFEVTKDGTLFLDEIGDLPLSMQVKLLRALEEKEITRVGGHDTIKVNPRIISASHKNLRNMILEGAFREDLFYRLNIVPIYIPPLRDRGYDVIILSRFFLKHFAEVYNKDIAGFTAKCEKLLLSYSYPGNIRELRNLIEYAAIFEENSLIGTENINKKLGTGVQLEHKKLADKIKAYEKSIIENELKRFGDSVDAKREVARQLGISVATLYRKLEA